MVYIKICETVDEDKLSKCVIISTWLELLLLILFLSVVWLQVTKVKPNDKDAKAKYSECNKIVKRIAFEKAISVEENKKSVVDSINVDTISKSIMLTS